MQSTCESRLSYDVVYIRRQADDLRCLDFEVGGHCCPDHRPAGCFVEALESQPVLCIEIDLLFQCGECGSRQTDLTQFGRYLLLNPQLFFRGNTELLGAGDAQCL